MKIYKIILIFLLFFINPAFSQTYFCVVEQTTGVLFNAKDNYWESQSLNLTNNKYLVRPSKVKKFPFEVASFGNDSPFAFCKVVRGGVADIVCPIDTISSSVFKMHTDSKIFVYYNETLSMMMPHHADGELGYYVALGKCTEI